MASLQDVIRHFVSQGGVIKFFSLICEEKSPYKVGRHVEINLKLIHMASGVKTHMFGRHVERLEIVFMAVCGDVV